MGHDWLGSWIDGVFLLSLDHDRPYEVRNGDVYQFPRADPHQRCNIEDCRQWRPRPEFERLRHHILFRFGRADVAILGNAFLRWRSRSGLGIRPNPDAVQRYRRSDLHLLRKSRNLDIPEHCVYSM